MGLRIATNTTALNAQRTLGVTRMNLDKSLEKLASGSRINHAGDDAAGLAISEALRAQIPDGPARFRLAVSHHVGGEREVACGQRGIRGEGLSGGVQLQADADQALFEAVVQFLGKARAFGQNRLELQLRFFAGRNLES